MNYSNEFAHAVPFTTFLERAATNRDLWEAMVRRAPLHQAALDRVNALPGSWRLLVLADDWCGDAVNTLPAIARLAGGADNLDLRVIGREQVPDVMDRHLTKGARSIPVVILLDEDGEERGWWGPRPRALQTWFDSEGRRLEKAERYRELRKWYARDRGQTVAHEIALMLWCAVNERDGYRGTQPCAAAEAA